MECYVAFNEVLPQTEFQFQITAYRYSKKEQLNNISQEGELLNHATRSSFRQDGDLTVEEIWQNWIYDTERFPF